MELDEKAVRLDAVLASTGSLIVAYSGGADSAFLAFAAHRILGANMLAVIADSPSLPRRELADAVAFAQAHGLPLRILRTEELRNPEYQKNDAQRCFHCKEELFGRLEQLLAETGFAHIAYGMNLDDEGEFRPGQMAARSHQVLAPLRSAELSKADIRALARDAGLSIADKPASACLASRIEYGRAVTQTNLAQVERAEELLHDLGFHQVRVRHHGELARIEISLQDLPRALSMEMFACITRALEPVGYKYLALDMHGYRSGSMNAILPAASLVGSATTRRDLTVANS